MAVTQNQTLDTWGCLIFPGGGDAYDLSYNDEQQHPGNGVALLANEAKRYSVAKTQHGYSVDGLAAVKGSTVYSLTKNMRQAYAASVNGTDNNGGRSLDRPQLLPTS